MPLLNKISNTADTSKRVKTARLLTGYSRREFCEASGISIATLRMWENPINGRYGITGKGTKRFIAAINDAGVVCSQEWLLYGIGLGPYTKESLYSNQPEKAANKSTPEDKAIIQEIQIFKELNQNAVTFMVADDGMEPVFSIGDYVGGKIIDPHLATQVIGKFCMVETDGIGWSLRKLVKNPAHGLILTCINPLSTVAYPIIYNATIKNIAPVIWLRKPYSFTPELSKEEQISTCIYGNTL